MILALALCLLPLALPPMAHADETSVLKQIQLLNRVPEASLSEREDPAFSILREIYALDSPDFFTLRKLLGKAAVRKTLNPSTRCLLAGVISQRWDAFDLSGNLYLEGLKSKNPDLRDKARMKLVGFIKPAYIPVLIELLKVPGPNVLAYEVLQDVTGQHLTPKVTVWRKWWKTHRAKADLVGYLLKDTKAQVAKVSIHPFNQDQLWYVPVGVKDAQTPYENRSEKEQQLISEWMHWAKNDVIRYAEDWSTIKTVVDRISHQPDPRVSRYLERLTTNPGYGDYASVVLAWRGSKESLQAIVVAGKSHPTVGRMVARGSMGDRSALAELLMLMERHKDQPLSHKIMDDEIRNSLSALRTVGIIPAEQAFELLTHQNFEFSSAYTARDKKKAFKNAKEWLFQNAKNLKLDRRRGYYKVQDTEK